MNGAAPNGTPLVSVVIPAYNVAEYMGETLASVFAQRYANYEVLVVNDGSSDTPELEAAIEPFRDRVTYLTQPNGGPSAARNAAIRAARGEYIAFLDGDDQWLPNCVADQVATMLRDPGLAVVYGDARIIGDSAHAGKTLMQLSPSVGEASFVNLLTQRCAVTTSCAMVSREACVRAGMFDQALRRSEDFDLWLRIAHAGGRFAYTTKALGLYRRHGSGASSDLPAMADAVLAVLDKCEREMTLTEAERGAVATMRSRQLATKQFLEGKRAFVTGDFEAARVALLEANTVMRSRKLKVVLLALSVAPRALSWLYSLTTGRH